MDTFSHGLYGSVFFGRMSRKSFWLAFLFGVAPDVLVFGPRFVQAFFGRVPGFRAGEPPPIESIPDYIFTGYNITHSLVVFAVVFGILWLIRRKPCYELLAWPLHILLDIPTHSSEFFPTPFLWPFAAFRVDGVPWSHPYIFIPNVIIVSVLSVHLLVTLYRRKRLSAVKPQTPELP